MLIKKNLYLLISSIGLIVFGLNAFFEFISFENQKINFLILMLLSISNFILLIRMSNNETNLK
jgi:hypothetical protein